MAMLRCPRSKTLTRTRTRYMMNYIYNSTYDLFWAIAIDVIIIFSYENNNKQKMDVMSFYTNPKQVNTSFTSLYTPRKFPH